MIGSHTATTFSMRSQAAPTPPESKVKAAASAESLRSFIARLRLRLRWNQKSSPGPVDEQLLDHEEQQIGAVTHRAGDQDRTVHVGELIGDLGIDDPMTQTVDRPDEHLSDDDHHERDRHCGAQAHERLRQRLEEDDVFEDEETVSTPSR